MSGHDPRPWGSGLPGGDDEPTYEVSIVETAPGKPRLKQTTSGGAKTTAAWLRALADEIDPQKPIMRSDRSDTLRGYRTTTYGTFTTDAGTPA